MLGGILAGAAAGAAKSGEDIADSQIKFNKDTALREFENRLALEREAQIARLRQQIGREDTLWNATGEGGQAKLEYQRKEGELKNDQAAEGARKMAPVAADAAAQLERAKAGVETNTTIERGNNPAYVGAKQKITDAGESSSTKASRAASTAGQQLENKIKQDLWNLEQQRRKALDAGDMVAVERIEAKMRAIDRKAKDEGYEITKVIEEEDPLTGEKKTRTEKTTRRPAPPAGDGGKTTAAPTAGAPYKDGTILRRGNELFIVKDGRPVPYAGK